MCAWICNSTRTILENREFRVLASARVENLFRVIVSTVSICVHAQIVKGDSAGLGDAERILICSFLPLWNKSWNSCVCMALYLSLFRVRSMAIENFWNFTSQHRQILNWFLLHKTYQTFDSGPHTHTHTESLFRFPNNNLILINNVSFPICDTI